MSLSSVPYGGPITVTKELAEYYGKSITDFTDTKDVTCIEITSYDVGLDQKPSSWFVLTSYTEGQHCLEGDPTACRRRGLAQLGQPIGT